ncbi:MAG: sulfotransferase [Granulosicoccus sp.]|nr:sulfotransferase [Granulosicoccus sp.]
MSVLVPIMLRTFGRTGSTLLMQILGTDQRICFERIYPFEQRYLTYVYNMARMVRATPRREDKQWNNDVLFQSRHREVGCLPYGKVEAFDKEQLSTDCFLALWEQFSNAMCEKQAISDEEVAYYAEKVPNQVANYANEHLKARNIFLLRDPRDEMVSIMSFNQKRGFNSFGWQEGDSDISYAKKICSNRRQFLQHLVSFETNHRRISIRYEDLIRHGDREVDRLSDWLGVSLSMKEATRDKAIKKRHMTSNSLLSSVERWKSELSKDVLDIFRHEIGSELRDLGYTV